MSLRKIWLIVFTFEFSFFLLSCNAKTQSNGNVQSGPVMGYDKIKWGSSITNVREAYNLGDEVPLYQDSDDPNIVFLQQENISENIERREFYFNKWNAKDYQLYRVWVIYSETKNQNVIYDLNNMLQQYFGQITNTWEENPEVKNMPFFGGVTYIKNITHVIYGTYSPELEVELINERTGGQALGMTQQARDVNKVCYTWKRYRDAYRASQLGL